VVGEDAGTEFQPSSNPGAPPQVVLKMTPTLFQRSRDGVPPALINNQDWIYFKVETQRECRREKGVDCDCSLLVCRHDFALEDAVGSYACSLEALACVLQTAFFSGVHCRLPVDTKHPVQTQKVSSGSLGVRITGRKTAKPTIVPSTRATRSGVWKSTIAGVGIHLLKPVNAFC
jgi:hypothetical protein